MLKGSWLPAQKFSQLSPVQRVPAAGRNAETVRPGSKPREDLAIAWFTCELLCAIPVREVSVVFGAWMGVQFFGERAGGVRILAAALVVAGMFLIAVGG